MKAADFIIFLTSIIFYQLLGVSGWLESRPRVGLRAGTHDFFLEILNVWI